MCVCACVFEFVFVFVFGHIWSHVSLYPCAGHVLCRGAGVCGKTLNTQLSTKPKKLMKRQQMARAVARRGVVCEAPQDCNRFNGHST